MHKTARLAILSMLLVAVLDTSLWFLLRKEIYVPKPPGYPRIILLTHAHTPLQGSFSYTLRSLNMQLLHKTTRPKPESAGSTSTIQLLK